MQMRAKVIGTIKKFKMALTDVEDGQFSGKDDDERLVVVEAEGLGRPVLVGDVASFRREADLTNVATVVNYNWTLVSLLLLQL